MIEQDTSLDSREAAKPSAGSRKRGGLALGGLISVAGGGLSAGSNLLLAAMLGHSLGPAGTGSFFQLVAFFAIVANILELGADTGLVKFVSAATATGRHADLKPLIRVAVLPVIITGALAVAGIWIFSPQLVDVLSLAGLDPASAARVMRALGVGVPIAALTMVLLGAVRGLTNVSGYTLVQNVLIPAGRLALTGIAVLAGFGVEGVVYLWLAPLCLALPITIAMLVIALRRQPADLIAKEPTPEAELKPAFWRFSSARGVAAGVEIVLEWADVLLVAALLSPAEAGIYAVVTRCGRAGELLQTAARITLGPRVSGALASGQLGEVSRLNTLVSRVMILGAWPLYVFVGVFAGPTLSLFGREFAAGAPALAVICLGMAIACSAGSVQTILLMGGKSTWQLINKTACLVVNIGLNLILLPVFGITGAAIAWAVSVVLDSALAAWQSHRLGVRVDLRSLIVPAAGALIVAIMLAYGLSQFFGSGVVLDSVFMDLVIAFVLFAGVLAALGLPLRRKLSLTRH